MGKTDSKLRLWWCGWEVSDAMSQDDWPEEWPGGMNAWHSGTGVRGARNTHAYQTYQTFTGAVWAESAAEAMFVVRSAYGRAGFRIVERWPPRTVDPSIEPHSRFPGGYPQRPAVPS